jgi:hypothetical protein
LKFNTKAVKDTASTGLLRFNTKAMKDCDVAGTELMFTVN